MHPQRPDQARVWTTAWSYKAIYVLIPGNAWDLTFVSKLKYFFASPHCLGQETKQTKQPRCIYSQRFRDESLCVPKTVSVDRKTKARIRVRHCEIQTFFPPAPWWSLLQDACKHRNAEDYECTKKKFPVGKARSCCRCFTTEGNCSNNEKKF